MSEQPPDQQQHPRERTCKTCAWFKPDKVLWMLSKTYGDCQLEPKTENKRHDERCRHHAFTTGWLEDE